MHSLYKLIYTRIKKISANKNIWFRNNLSTLLYSLIDKKNKFQTIYFIETYNIIFIKIFSLKYNKNLTNNLFNI